MARSQSGFHFRVRTVVSAISKWICCTLISRHLHDGADHRTLNESRAEGIDVNSVFGIVERHLFGHTDHCMLGWDVCHSAGICDEA